MYVEDKDYLYIGTLYTDFTHNSVKLRMPHNFHFRVWDINFQVWYMTVTAIWKKPVRISYCRWFLPITITSFIIL
jgi:hypothetical protein